MDLRAIGFLAPAVERLHKMLLMRVSPERCWRRFVVGTGSELVRRCIRIFRDGISVGGDAEDVGFRAADMSMSVEFTREKRKLVASTFRWLALTMHVAIVFLLVFVIEIVDGFGSLVEGAGIEGLTGGSGAAVGSVLSFNFANLDFLRTLLIPVVIVLSIANAITPKIVEGGYNHKVFFNLGFTLSTAGMSLLMAPKLTSLLFAGPSAA